jgi:hypothetical protein
MVNGVAATAIRSEGQYATIKDRAVFSSTALFYGSHGRCGDASALSWATLLSDEKGRIVGLHGCQKKSFRRRLGEDSPETELTLH